MKPRSIGAPTGLVSAAWMALLLFLSGAWTSHAWSQDCGQWLPGQGVPGFIDSKRVVSLAAGGGAGTGLYAVAMSDTDNNGDVYKLENGEWTAYPRAGLPAGYFAQEVIEWNGQPAIIAAMHDTYNSPRGVGIYSWNGAQWTGGPPISLAYAAARELTQFNGSL